MLFAKVRIMAALESSPSKAKLGTAVLKWGRYVSSTRAFFGNQRPHLASAPKMTCPRLAGVWTAFQINSKVGQRIGQGRLA
jgi:hypothetical protein